MGVALETDTRSIQQRNDENGFYCSLNPEWLSQLQMADQGEPCVHSMSFGIKPVVVQNPAIIIQPGSILEGDSD